MTGHRVADDRVVTSGSRRHRCQGTIEVCGTCSQLVRFAVRRQHDASVPLEAWRALSSLEPARANAEDYHEVHSHVLGQDGH